MKKMLALFLIAILVLAGCRSGKDEIRMDGMKDGVYETTADGHEGKIKVATTVQDGKLAKIEVLESMESDDIGKPAMEILRTKIVEKQTLSVDAVTGATFSSNALKEAVKLAILEAKGDLEGFNKEVDKEAGEAIEKTADVVVIGGGGAGLSASVAAAENGSKVILIEKTPILGGNTVRAGGAYNAVDPEGQKKLEAANEAAMASVEDLLKEEEKSELHKKWKEQLKIDLEEYKKGGQEHLFDSVALHILQTYKGGDYEGNLELIEKLVQNSLPTLKWLESNGMIWKEEIATVPGGLWPRAHIPKNAAGGDFIATNQAKAAELGVELMMSCTGKELIMKDGRVVGVLAELEDGTKVTLHANKAIIIASGGFAGNKEMRQHYDPSLLEDLGTTNSPAIMGDGIVMAEKVGAKLVGMEFIQCLPWGTPKTGSLNGWMGGIGVEYYYQVNSDGKRFMAEDGRRDVMTKALLEQKGALSYVITDTNRESEHSEVNLWGDNIEELVKSGKVFRADSIEELAKQIKVDPKVLQETHEAFNASVESGVDAEFGRKLFGDKIDKAPFYASPRMPTVHHTMGGIQIDLQARVLDKDGKVIPGLYAAGEVTGGIHGKNRLGGNALVDVHLFGREAGKNAANEEPQK